MIIPEIAPYQYWLLPGLVVLLCLLWWGRRRYVLRRIVSRWHEDRADLVETLADVDTPVSVIVVSSGDGYSVERNLPAILGQQRVTMEVVVVDADVRGVEGVSTADALKRLKCRFPQLRQTYVPMANDHHQPGQLAAMLGARAARYDTLLFVPPTFEPDSSEWILDLLQYVDATVHVLVDYSHRDSDYSESYWERSRERRRMMKVAKKGTIDAAGGSMMVQKDWFLRSLNGEGEAGECVYLYTDHTAGRRDVVRAKI